MSQQMRDLWSDPKHWTSIGLYRCAGDPRWFVSKRQGAGWTVNTAHYGSWLGVAALIAFCTAPILINVAMRSPPRWLFPLSMMAPILVVTLFMLALNVRDRKSA